MNLRQVPTISIILLTHATLSHVGAYAHCCKHIPLFSRIPVYATTPVISLSRTLLQDLYVSTPLASSFLPASSSLADSSYGLASPPLGHTNILLPPPTTEEIGIYFAPAYPLNYSQPHQPLASPFSPSLDGLIITAYGAGHSLGGTIWQIQYGSESIVYAVDWHQARENVFPGAAWLSGSTGAEIAEPLRQPTALVCSSKGAEAVAAPGGRQQRDEQLLSKLRSAIQQGGNVLIPCDTSARVLDMVYMLDRAWTLEKGSSAANSLQKAKLYFASTTASATLRYARSMLEWMDESITREFEATNSGPAAHGKANQPFELKHLKLIERRSQLDRVLSHSGCKIFLASDSSLEWGLSRHLLDTFAAQATNMVILTESTRIEPTSSISLSSRLRQILRQRTEKLDASGAIQLEAEILDTRDVQTSPLTGNDLPIYQQYLARQRQRQDVTIDKGATTIETSADVVEQGSDSSSSSDESDTEHQGKSMNTSAALTSSKNKLGLTDEELGINVLVRRKNVHDFDVRGKKGRDKVFPFVAKRRRNDDFGDLIRPEAYLRAEERDEVEGQETTAETKKANAPIGQKRKWGDTEFGKADGRRRRTSGSAAKRRKGGVNGDISKSTTNGTDATASDVEESEEESDYEPAEAVLRGPMKATFTKTSITLKMKLTSIDFSGIHDQRSLQMLIPLIKPRKLILTGGTESETMTLADTCQKLLAASDLGQPKADADIVFAPRIGEAVDASVDTNAWTIKLSQTLFRKLQWQTIRKLGIVTINARVELEEQITEQPQDPEAKRQKTDEANQDTAKAEAKEQTSKVAPVLKDLPTNLNGPTRLTNQPLHVGDLRLAELRKIMQADGHTAEFKGEGTILVDGLIAVRKSGIGRIEIEGGGFAMPGNSARLPGASFDNVKRKIYQGLALVAAR